MPFLSVYQVSHYESVNQKICQVKISNSWLFYMLYTLINFNIHKYFDSKTHSIFCITKK